MQSSYIAIVRQKVARQAGQAQVIVVADACQVYECGETQIGRRAQNKTAGNRLILLAAAIGCARFHALLNGTFRLPKEQTRFL